MHFFNCFWCYSFLLLLDVRWRLLLLSYLSLEYSGWAWVTVFSGVQWGTWSALIWCLKNYAEEWRHVGWKTSVNHISGGCANKADKISWKSYNEAKNLNQFDLICEYYRSWHAVSRKSASRMLLKTSKCIMFPYRPSSAHFTLDFTSCCIKWKSERYFKLLQESQL